MESEEPDNLDLKSIKKRIELCSAVVHDLPANISKDSYARKRMITALYRTIQDNRKLVKLLELLIPIAKIAEEKRHTSRLTLNQELNRLLKKLPKDLFEDE